MTATVAAATQIRRRRRVSFLPLDTAKVWYRDGAVLQKRSSYSPTVMMASRRFDAVEQGALIKRRSSKSKTDKAPERFRATGHSLKQGTGASRLRGTGPGSSTQIGRCRESPREKI